MIYKLSNLLNKRGYFVPSRVFLFIKGQLLEVISDGKTIGRRSAVLGKN